MKNNLELHVVFVRISFMKLFVTTPHSYHPTYDCRKGSPLSLRRMGAVAVHGPDTTEVLHEVIEKCSDKMSY